MRFEKNLVLLNLVQALILSNLFSWRLLLLDFYISLVTIWQGFLLSLTSTKSLISSSTCDI